MKKLVIIEVAIIALLFGAGVAVAVDEFAAPVQPLSIREYPLVAPAKRVEAYQFHYVGDILQVNIPDLQLGVFNTGSSMLPIAQEGHLLIMTPNFDSQDIIIGDIIVFTSGTRLIGHQVVDIKQGELGLVFHTKGTGNFKGDFLTVKASDIKFLALGVLW